LYNFLQMAYGPELKSLERIPFSTEAERWVFTRLAEAPLSIKEAIQLEPDRKRVLALLLTQYVMFLTMFDHLNFEPGFLVGTSDTTLGSGWLDYIGKHRWPFPQMLPQ
ncbi:hypothetical protein KZY67_13085, partial [Prevotella melaninogenica]